MKLLVDTSVWSLALRRQKAAPLSAEEERLKKLLPEALNDGRVVMIGPIRQELLSGIRDQAQFDKLKSHLEAFRDEALETSDYEEAARMSNVCRSNGLECGPLDILVCAVSARRGWQVLTSDSGLIRCLDLIKAQSQGRTSRKSNPKSAETKSTHP